MNTQQKILLKQLQAREYIQQFFESLESKLLCDLIIMKDTLKDMDIILDNELQRRNY